MEKIRQPKFLIWTLSLVSLFMMLGMFSPNLAAAQTNGNCEKLYDQFNFTGYINGEKKTQNTVEGLPRFCSAPQIINFVIKLILYFAGSFAVLFIMVGGFLYVTSAGNEEQAEKGRKILINAVIGLVVIIMAFAIVQIIGGLLTSGANTSTPTTQNPPSTNPNANPNSNPNSAPADSVSVSGPSSIQVDQVYTLTATVPVSLISCGINQNSAIMTVTSGGGTPKTFAADGFVMSGPGNSNAVFTFSNRTPQSLGYVVPTGQTKTMHVSISVCLIQQYQTDVAVKPSLAVR